MSYELSSARHRGARPLRAGGTPAADPGRHRAARRRSRSAVVAGVLTAGTSLLAAPLAAQAVTPASAMSSTPVVPAAHGGVALIGQQLRPGHSLHNHGVKLYLNHSGDLKLYSAHGSLLWTSKTSGHHDATAAMQSDGNFVLRTSSGKAFWSTRTSVDGSRLIVLKSAMVAVQTRSGKVVWSEGAVPAPAPATTPQGYAISELPKHGWSSSQWPCLKSLWNRESGWDYRAENASSGAYGIPQSLPGSKMASAGSDWRTNADTQINWGLGYIASTYGTPCGAWGHSQSTGWY